MGPYAQGIDVRLESFRYKKGGGQSSGVRCVSHYWRQDRSDHQIPPRFIFPLHSIFQLG
jgi:hypothetical protein